MILASMTEPELTSTNAATTTSCEQPNAIANSNGPSSSTNQNTVSSICSPTSAASSTSNFARPCSFPFAANMNPINNSAFQSSLPTSSDFLAAAAAGGTSPILQSLFARIEAEFYNLAQENARLQMENSKLFQRIEDLQHSSSPSIATSAIPGFPPSTAQPTSVPHSNTIGAMPNSSEHGVQSSLYDGGGASANAGALMTSRSTGSNNNGAATATSLNVNAAATSLLGVVASSSGDNKSKLKVAQRTKTGINKIVSSFKAGTLEAVGNSGAAIISHRSSNSVTCSLIYYGHSDSVWDVSSTPDSDVFVSASSDKTVKLWAPGVGMQPVYSYAGHQGCVNSARLHPTEPLVISASGDGSVHVWRYSKEKLQQRKNVSLNNNNYKNIQSSGDDDLANDEAFFDNNIGWNHHEPTDDPSYDSTLQPPTVLKQAEVTISPPPGSSGATGPVMAAEFLRGSGSSYVVSGGWDQHLIVSDALTGRVVRVNEGHEGSITNVSCASNDALFASSSEDRTFRVWDLNNPKVVFVCEGHSRKVRTAVFCGVGSASVSESGGPWPHILSASDDSTLKLWDLRNMSSPLISIRANCGINRFSIWPYMNNHNLHCGGVGNSFGEPQLVACPLDNRSIRIYSLSIASARSRRLASIPARSGGGGGHSGNSSNRSIRTNSSGGGTGGGARLNIQSHQRMVSAVTWINNGKSLISGSIDGSLLEWNLSSLNRHSKTSIQLLDSISHLNNSASNAMGGTGSALSSNSGTSSQKKNPSL